MKERISMKDPEPHDPHPFVETPFTHQMSQRSSPMLENLSVGMSKTPPSTGAPKIDQRKGDRRKDAHSRQPNSRPLLPGGAAERKDIPLASGFMDYFPAAIVAVTEVSKRGNDQHNPGEPIHWARGKSMDQADTMMRHFQERGKFDDDGQRHSAKMVWRALALLQIEMEQDGYPIARGARFPAEAFVLEEETNG